MSDIVAPLMMSWLDLPSAFMSSIFAQVSMFSLAMSTASILVTLQSISILLA